MAFTPAAITPLFGVLRHLDGALVPFLSINDFWGFYWSLFSSPFSEALQLQSICDGLFSSH